MENAEESLYQKIWDKYQFNTSVEKDSRVDVASRLIERGTRFLDIGCGDGLLCHLVKDKYEQVYGIDISPRAVEIAKSRGINAERVNLNTDALPFEDNYFDTVVCLDVIEHVFDPVRLLAEINRVLKTGGTSIVSAPNIRTFGRIATLLFLGRFPGTSDDKQGYDGGHLHYFTYSDITNLLNKNGFEVTGKYGVFGKNFLKEFRSAGILIKANKLYNVRKR